MIHIPKVLEFWQRTAILVDYEFENVDIMPSSAFGFDNHRLAELKQFCGRNPDFHIISLVNGCLYFNKVMKNATQYYLAQGDSNPDLVCFENYKMAEFIDSLIERRRRGCA